MCGSLGKGPGDSSEMEKRVGDAYQEHLDLSSPWTEDGGGGGDLQETGSQYVKTVGEILAGF